MAGYLFDTNIWSYAFDQAPFVIKRIQKLENSQMYLSAVVWGEVICGANANPEFSLDQYRKFIHKDNPLVLPVDKNVAENFGALKAVIFEKRSAKTSRSKEGRVSLLKSPIPSKDLGVHENDLWIAAQALTYNLVLVTCDRMQTIFDLAPKKLKYELWPVR